MTPNQQVALDLIKKLNDAEFEAWFEPSEVMAFVQIESSFRSQAHRFEPRLNESSYGLMQVLASTAKSVGLVGNPIQMYDSEVGLRYGMKVARLYWEQEQRHFGRDPTYEEWAASYNEGVGGAERDVAAQRDPDPAYTALWDKAQEFWAAQGVDA
jgi:soluble lytic murein transglycosylase-like protein